MFHVFERDRYLQCIEVRNVLAVFGCGWASFAAKVVSAASHSVFGENGRMIPPLQVVYTAWAPGLAYTPSSLKIHRNIFAVFGLVGRPLLWELSLLHHTRFFVRMVE